MARRNRNLRKDRIQAAAISTVIWLLLRLPFRLRLYIAGGMSRLAILLIPALRQRITGNLDLVWPELSPDRRTEILYQVATGFGRSMIEIYSPKDLQARRDNYLIGGSGFAALQTAANTGKGAIIISGHFGLWEAARIALRERGFEIGGVYRPNNNTFYDPPFVWAMQQYGEPILPNTASGTRDLIRHVSKGGHVALLIDQHIQKMPKLMFFGKTALTATFAAELALKYDLPLIPSYAIRRADSDFVDIVMEAPIARSDAMTMTQALNDSLEARIRENPGQWHWLHQRWR